MGYWKRVGNRAGAMFLSVTMLSTVIPGGMTVKADVGTGSSAAYEKTEESQRTITTNPSNPVSTVRNWTITWSDEFNDGELDDSKWTSMVGTGAEYSDDGWGNSELEYYTDGDNIDFVTEDGVDCLEITAKKTTDDDKNKYSTSKQYTSARLWTMSDETRGGKKNTKFAKTYGRIESRIKISGAKDGLWPAFWMMPSDDVYGTWAASGELDIMEARGRQPNIVDGTLHFGSQWPNNKSIGDSYDEELGFYDDSFTIEEWHTYAVEWLPGEIRWYVDDVCYYTENRWYATSGKNAVDYTYPAPFDQDFYILLNLAVGGNYDNGRLDPNLDEAKMLVDYVRVYDLDGGYDEDNVVKPVDEIAPNPIKGNIADNYVGTPLMDCQLTTDYKSETENRWFVSKLEGGDAALSMADDALKVNVTQGGSQNYSVQLIHNVPLTKGYRYVMNFWAKSDEAKTLNAKFGNIGGYPAYSDSMEINLKTSWKEYTYIFDMANNSDETGRIEINMGQTTGACYFKDFSIVTTGQTPVIGADDEKQPLADGNHIYNGTFDQGDGRIYFWHAMDNTEIVGSKATMDLKITGNNAVSGAYQSGINLLQNDTYKLTFDAKAETAGDMKVKLVSKAGDTYFESNAITLGTDYTGQIVTFTMDEGVTDTDAVIQFVTGNNTVYLDNIKMVRTTNNNLDWSEVDIWPAYNYDFFNGTDGWNLWSEGAGSLNAWVENGKLIADMNIGDDPQFYCVGIQTPAMSLKAGIPYKFIINLRGEAKKIKVELPGAGQVDYDFAKDTPLELEYTPVTDVPAGKVTLYCGLEKGHYRGELESIDVIIDTDKITLPAGTARPASVASAGRVKAGDAFVINHNNNDWAAQIEEVYFNDQPIGRSQIDTSVDNKITFEGSLMPDEGSYTIEFAATGYCNTKAIVQKALPADGNVIVNGKFNTDADSWSTWFAGELGTGELKADDGEAVLHITGGGEGNPWDAQLKQAGLELTANDYYMLSFDAYATVARPIKLEFANLGTASKTDINLSTTKKTYYVIFRNVSNTKAASILFMAGNVDGCLSDFAAIGEHNICIDNVSLKAVSEQEATSVPAPTLSLNKQALLGRDVVLSYTENTVWEGKNKTITIDDVPVASQNVSIDTENNLLILDRKAFSDVGTKLINIAAPGHDETSLKVKILENEQNLLNDSWETWKDDAETGTFTANGNQINVTFKSTLTSEWNGPEIWSMLANNTNIVTETNKDYILTFDAELTYQDSSLTTNRELVLELGKDADKEHRVQLEPGKHTYSVSVKPGKKTDYNVQFLLGGAEFGVAEHTLAITNITFRDIVTPTITKNPANATYEQKAAATALQAAATPTEGGSLEYQWYKNTKDAFYGATAIAGAESATYTPSTSTAGTTYYYCVVTNTNNDASGVKTGEAMSEIAKVAVTPLPNAAQTPNITKQPANATYTYGATATDLSVAATSTDGGTISYQWYKNSKNSTTGGTAIAGATKATYRPATSATGTTYYYCIVTNTNRKVLTTTAVTKNSNIVSVVVNKAANKVDVKTSVTKVDGDKAFNLNAKAKGSLSYKSADTKVVKVDKNGKVTLVGCGKTTITITAGNSNYKTVTQKVTITVSPKKETVTKFKSSKAKTATVTWKKDAKASGYEIQYSTNKSFKGAKPVTISSNKTTSKNLTKLTGKKKYYVRVRAYKTVGKTKVYGAWSETKNTTVKK